MEVSRSAKSAHRQVQRSRIILKAARGWSNAAIARHVGCTEKTVRKWRSRFAADSRVVSLVDQQRSGRPPLVMAEDRCVLLKLACQRPADSGIRFRETWTLSNLGSAFRAETGIARLRQTEH